VNPRRTVLVVGSLHYDIFVEAPHRPEAGETVTGHRWFPKSGGKGGNQATAIAGTGCRCRMVSAVGRDDFATFLMDRLAAAGVETDRVQVTDGAGSGMSVAIADAGGDYGAVIVSGSNLLIEPAVFDDPCLWDDVGYLILQNEVPEEINLAAARAARSRGIEIVLNAAPARPMGMELLSLVDVLVVNAGEARMMCGVHVDAIAAAERAALLLAEHFPVAIVTAGGNGVAAASGKEAFFEPAHKVEVISTHGAGDHFIGNFVSSRLSGQSLRGAIRHANNAAAAHISRKS